MQKKKKKKIDTASQIASSFTKLGQVPNFVRGLAICEAVIFQSLYLYIHFLYFFISIIN